MLAKTNVHRNTEGSMASSANDFGSISSIVSPSFVRGYAGGKSLAEKESAVNMIRQPPPKRPAVARGPPKSTARKPANGRGDAFEHLWTASDDALKCAPVKQSNVEKKRKILDVYKPTTACTPSPKVKTSSFINRQAKLRETERVNKIIVKKLLNVKSTFPKV